MVRITSIFCIQDFQISCPVSTMYVPFNFHRYLLLCTEREKRRRRNLTINLKLISFTAYFQAAVQNNVQESKLDDSMNQLIKHPLQHSWTLWYYEPDRSRSWEDNLNKVSTFNTVEDFWSLFNHIKQPSELKVGADYSMFKDAIRPMWEDKANERGGCWTLAFGRTQRMELDRYWIDTVNIFKTQNSLFNFICTFSL